ncbi:MAG: xanthine dehydrogenase molybdopterin binding subunit [Polyangiaceae bacterium]|nr:xanthine dehydrogenase molybdopterin binding subunit [Polyangiaceae bacterium]
MGSFEFTLNGERIVVDGEDPETTLLQWLRKTGRTGTKEGCAEGDCGACTVGLRDQGAHGSTYRAINSCIAFLPMFAGREVVTVEGLAEGERLHPVQDAMVKHYGSQCGYCTPGFIMSMFEGYYRDDLKGADGRADIAKVVDQLNGNLCRCTGYRPIRDAMLDALEAKASRPSDLFQLRLSKDAPAVPPPLRYEADGKVFLRPGSLSELLEIKREHGAKYEIVAGATELGVYMNKRGTPYPKLVSVESVPELKASKRDDRGFTFGGAVPLTEVEEVLAGELPLVQKMLWAFASRPIRSRATLAGNLVTASPIGDMAPVLLALGADVVLASAARGERTVPLSDFFTGYRQTVLAEDEVLKCVFIPHAPAGLDRRSDSFKVSKRRELDIAIVAAGFVVDLDSAGIVKSARFGLGGVAATPSRAPKAEAHLVGRAWNVENVRAAGAILESEFSPIDDVRSGAPYRKGLLASLLEKFFAGEKSLSQDEPFLFDRGTPSVVDDPSRSLAHESGHLHVTGRAQYVDDIAARRDALFIWPVSSPHARAKILSVDTAEAAAMPGVVTILTAKDVPGENDVGAIRKDEPLFAESEASFAGHIVAGVGGRSFLEARRAAAKVRVEYEPLPAIVGIADAIAQKSYHTEPHVIARGDVDAALASSPRRLSGELHIGGQEHFYLESHASWAEPGEDGDVFVCSSTQHPSEVQAVVSHVLHVARNKVVVEAPRMGGGFGGKETQGNTWAAIVALAALKTGRLVRVQLDRDVDMMLTGKRHPFFGSFDVGFDDDGRLRAVRCDLTNDGGWALDLSESICDRGLFHLDNAYFLPAVRFVGRVAKTNTVSHTAFRGFGGPQGMVVIEDILDRVAGATGLAPEVVRERNLYCGSGETNTTHYGQDLVDTRIQRVWPRLLAESRFVERRAELERENAKSERIKRGIAITPVKFGISFTATFLNQAGALVLVYRDGTVQVNHGGTEMGQGLYTKMLGIAMRELGLPRESIRVMRTRTDKVPNTSATAASSGADLNGAAVRDACEQIRARIAPVAASVLSERIGAPVDPARLVFANGSIGIPNRLETVSWEAVVDRAYMQQTQLSATGFYRTPGIGYDKKAGRGKPFYYFAYGAAVSEVEVDGYSGMKRVTRVDILHDVGDSLNPGVDRGQIEGAFVQGMGWLTGEELKWDKRGKLLSHSASTYQIPSIGDAPVEFHVALLDDAYQDGVVHGSKAVGEPPLMLAISVREAIRDAIAQFGAPGGQVDLPCPATHEAIFHTVRARLAQQDEATVRAAE